MLNEKDNRAECDKPFGNYFCAYTDCRENNAEIYKFEHNGKNITAKVKCNSCGQEDWIDFRQHDLLSWLIRPYLHASNNRTLNSDKDLVHVTDT